MKKALKIIGIIFGALFGLIGVATGIAAITGVFSDEEINIQTLSWETDQVRIVEDYKAVVNFSPADANQLDVELKLVYEDCTGIVEFPSTVKAGEEFTIKVLKDENGNNFGGEVVIQAKTPLVVSQTNLRILVDVAIPTDGLIIASDFDSNSDANDLDAGASSFNMYVYTDPSKALNPNTGKSIDLLEAYKDIQIKSAEPQALYINPAGVEKTGFYCKDYIAHGHKGPFKDSSGVTFKTTTCDKGTTLQQCKYIEYVATAIESTQSPVIVTAKALRTYDMQEQYVDKSDDKYYVNNEMTSEGRQQYLTDLSNYVSTFKDYIAADTRVNYDSIATTTVNYASGAAFIDAITQTNINGDKYIKIEDNRVHEEAAYFYLFVETRALFNIEQIAIADVVSRYENGGTKVEFTLFDDVQQYDVEDIKSIFDISLKPTSDEFTSADLEHRLKELRVMTIMNKAEDSTSTTGFDPNGYVFEIENPVSTAEVPIWKIRCINSIAEEDKTRAVRLRFYIPSSKTGEYTVGDPYADVPVQILISEIDEFSLYDTGENALKTKMILNTEDVSGYSYRQVLDESRYILSGLNGKEPTYTTVKFFATKSSAKTKDSTGSETSYYKINFNNDGAPTLLTMTYGEQEPIEAYEISYKVAGQNYLEALNVTNGDTIEIFAAIIKTNHLGQAVDTSGIVEGEEGYSGNYQIIRRTPNSINISIDYYLEKLNFYTITDDTAPVYKLRNVPATGTSSNTDTVQLLADQDYTLKASPYYLTEAGEFDASYADYSNPLVDYQSNLLSAVNNAYHSSRNLDFGTSSTDIEVLQVAYDNTIGMFTINIEAKIDKSASFGHTTDAFDFKASALPGTMIANTFNSIRSTVNMIVNYAKIESFKIATTVDTGETNKDYYVLSPIVKGLSSEDHDIYWNDVEASAVDFEISHDYHLDIQNKTTGEGGVVIYNSKIDSSYANDVYVNNYIDLITNPENTDAFKIEWDLQFDHLDGYVVGGTAISGKIDAGWKVEDFISITETIVEDEHDPTIKHSVPVLDIIKGTKDGVFIKATCRLSLYSTTSGYIDYKSTTINLILKQSPVVFEMYTPYNNGEDIFIENGPGSEALKGYDAFVVKGGENDGTLAEGYDLLADYGTSTSQRRVYVRNGSSEGAYVLKTNPDGSDKTSYRLINAILDDDGELAGWCTFSINNVTDAPIYFKDAEGNKIYTASPSIITEGGKKRFQLIVYAEHISSSKEATITVTSPFGVDRGTYHIYVQSSIVLSRPDTNIETSTTSTADGHVDLSTKFTAVQEGTQLKTSFETIGDNSIYGYITGTETIQLSNGSTETLKTTFIPKEVYAQKSVQLRMYYYLPTDETGIAYTKHEVMQINSMSLAVLVQPGYELEVNADIKNSASGLIFSVNSGITKDFFTEYAANPSAFIIVRNKNTGLPVAAAQMVDILKRLVVLTYDENALSASDKLVFASLFDSQADKNEIENGKLITKAITNNIVLPINISFKEGSTASDTISYNPSLVTTFYCEVKASVAFMIGESASYKSTEIVVDGNNITNTKLGHEYDNFNVDTDGDGEINLGTYSVELFDYNKGTSSLLSLHGSDNVELLTSTYQYSALYKFNASTRSYELVSADYHVEIQEVFGEVGLESLMLHIVNSVNESTHYKLAINTTINLENQPYEYFFSVYPTYRLKTNYPLVDKVEKVKPATVVDMFDNFINTENRIQMFTIDSTGKEYIYSITASPSVNNGYILSTTYVDAHDTEVTITKLVVLEIGVSPVTLSFVGGTTCASIIGNTVEFVAPSQTTERVTVRATLFNGAYVDYVFEAYQTLTIPVITVNNDEGIVTAYADNSLNILDYIKSSAIPDGFKFIIKYNSYSRVKATVGEGYDVTDLDDVNQIIEYSGDDLIVTFEDVLVETDISFSIWHTYSVSGDSNSSAVLNIRLLPNLAISVNKTGSNNTVTELVSGVETTIISKDSTTWLKLANSVYNQIKVEVVDINSSQATTEVVPLDLDITIDATAEVVKFKSNNVGVQRTLTFRVSKLLINEEGFFVDEEGDLVDIDGNRIDEEGNILTGIDPTAPVVLYYYEFEIVLVPNINLHSSYLGTEAIPLTGAAGIDRGSGTSVLLNDKVNAFAPTDFNGGDLVVDPRSSATEDPTNRVRFTTNFSDANGNIIPQQLGLSGAALSDTSLTVTLDAVNKEQKVYVRIDAEWGHYVRNVHGSIVWETTSVEPYTAVLGMTVIPNLITTGDNSNKIVYSSGTGGSISNISVYAGSSVGLDFANSLAFGQLGTNASVVAYQTASSGNVLSNVILNKDDENQYYEIVEETAGDFRIYFKAVPNATNIEIPVYYDLTGTYKGVYSKTGNGVAALDFDNKNIVYNPNQTIKVSILPSIKTIGYTSDSHSTEATAIDITEQFLDIYYGEGYKTNATSFGPTDVQTKDNINAEYKTIVKNDTIYYNVNGYPLINNLFTFGEEENVTWNELSADESKVYVDRESLYSSLIYNVTVKKGLTNNTAPAEWDTSGWTFAATPSQYYTIDKETGIIYFMPPKSTEGEAIVVMVEVQLPGQTGETSKQTVYFKLQHSGNYIQKTETETNTINIGSGGEIIDTYTFVNQEPEDNVSGDVYGINLNETHVVSGNTKYIDKYNLNEKFSYGLLLRSYTREDGVKENKEETPASNRDLKKVYRESNIYFYYIFNNIDISFKFADATSDEYASILLDDDGTYYLIPEIYYEKAGGVVRTIQLTVTAGGISNTYSISIYPRTATHNFEWDGSSSFTNNLTVAPEGAEEAVEVYSSEIEIVKTDDLSDEEYALISQWLTYSEDENHVKYDFEFVPDLHQLKSEVTFRFLNTICVDRTEKQIFEKYFEVTLNPIVGLKFDKMGGVSTNISGDTTDILVATTFATINSTDALFASNVFELDTDDYTDISFTIAEVDNTLAYSDYVAFTGLVSTAGLDVFDISETTKIQLIAKQLLNDVTLPYTATLTFTVDSTEYTLVHNFNLIIKANVGITNLRASYTVAASSGSAVITRDMHAGVVEIIGSGTVSFKVLAGSSFSVSGGTANLSDADLNNKIRFDYTLVTGTQQIDTITINYSNLAGCGFTQINNFTFEIYYTVDVTDSEGNTTQETTCVKQILLSLTGATVTA